MLTLYRRHRRECKAGHPEQSFSTEFDERKRGWKRCECPIVVSGTLKKQFRRHSTALWEWEAARSIAREFEAAGSWDRTIPESPQPTIAELLPDLTKITDATEAFLDRCRNRSISSETLRKYKTLPSSFPIIVRIEGMSTPTG